MDNKDEWTLKQEVHAPQSSPEKSGIQVFRKVKLYENKSNK